MLLQLLERVAVPEKRGYMYEDVVEECLHLGRLISQQAHVLPERCQAAQGEPSSQPPPDARELVFTEVGPNRAADQEEHLLELAVIFEGRRAFRRRARGGMDAGRFA